MRRSCEEHGFVRAPRSRPLCTVLVAWLGLVVACGDESAPASDEDGGADTAGEDIDAIDVAYDDDGDAPDAALDGGDASDAESPIACLSSSGCNAERPGTLCVDGVCVSCSGDSACIESSTYGDEYVCSDGRCVGCPRGGLGCGCDDETCDEGICEAGVCVACDVGTEGCQCDDGECGAGLSCGDDGVCVDCPTGQQGCACLGGGGCAGDSICVDGLCAPDPCQAAQLDCPCDGGLCEEGLACHDDGFCRACDADWEGCACDAEEGCVDDLVCADDHPEMEGYFCRAEVVCENAGCADNELCDEMAEGEDALCLGECAPGYVWIEALGFCELIPDPNCANGAPGSILSSCQLENRECVELAGDAECGQCLEGHVEDGGCRPVVTCDEISESCAELSRTCSEAGARADATCGDCVQWYVDEGAEACVPATLSCDPGAEFSIASLCAAEFRDCEEGVTDVRGNDDSAACMDCVDGFAENPDADNACQELASCASRGCAALGRDCIDNGFAVCGDCLGDLVPSDPDDNNSVCRGALGCDETTCADDEFCIESETGADAECVRSSCAEGEALDQRTDTCVTCTTVCSSSTEGATGRIWPYTRDRSNDCVCETLDGYYADPSRAALPQPCDADGDGWVRASAEEFVESSDAVIAANARCSVRSIDRFVLRNEFDQELELHICGTDLVEADDLESDCELATPADLYENATLDDEDAVGDLTGFFPYYRLNGTGRVLHASEMNPLTKACVSETGDHNNNDVADVEEFQGMDAPDGVSFNGLENLWIELAYFTELHRGWYEDRPGEDHGVYVIAERSRCADGSTDETPFALGYSSSPQNDWWRSCTRGRNTAYALLDEVPGFDFAQFSCDATSGGCDIAPAPIENVSEFVDGVALHGLCEDIILPPVDGVWRGMNHASQFQCVVAADGAFEAWEVERDELYDGSDSSARYEFNACGVACPESDSQCSDDCVDGECATSESWSDEPNPRAPILDCEPTTASERQVGFVAVRFVDPAGTTPEYERGCINEWAEWPDLCPGWVDPSSLEDDGFQPVIGDGLFTNFGKLICGCGVNYGGSECEIGCPGAAVSDDFAADSGIWLCGEFAATAPVSDGNVDALEATDGAGQRWRVRGDISSATFGGNLLCEESSCESGYVLEGW